ncbi:immunoglobulin-like domain-containing protein [Clostridium sp. AM58-1XD]|uniref:immunoglobulin-like domain-containing protein n=1 Tax=Clostridium sp. AM58-1XD TaxID=2292307 RepID=UPI000E47864D|nr:immunoglobulin-like domain-containing protein [Clostridium sp. AM58-1XD]RGY97358.1 hypothetical protein DXA13_14625 [Clostridium sp. AM58-1XD]
MNRKTMWKSVLKKGRKVENVPIRFCRMQAVCVAAGILLYIAAEAAGGKGPFQDGKVRRPAHGMGEVDYDIYVSGLDREEIPVKITVSEKQYDKFEAEEVFKKAWQELLTEIIGDNQSLTEVRTDMKLPGWMDEYGIRVRWYSENQDVIDNYGRVMNEENPSVKKGGIRVWLKAVMSDGEHDTEFDLPVNVYPPLLTEQEQAEAEFRRMIRQMDEEQKGEEWFTLPKDYRGKMLSYREKGTDSAGFLPVMGVFAAVLYGFKGRQEEWKEKKKRNRQMLLDYSEIVSRLLVFIGAGMTVRSSWEKIVADYEKRIQEGRGKRRYAYEEMSRTYYQIRTGRAEGEAYEEFGRRCGLQPYMKLSGLLIQNRKEGMKNLNQVMRTEMISAFEERKNLARRQGEEAGTKLLLPLFLMLGVVMIMVMVPAMMAFS